MAEFFTKFPTLDYKTSVGNDFVTVTDIFFRTKFSEYTQNSKFTYYKYAIRDGETPDSLAYEYYGSPEYHWIIMYSNDIVNPYYDWVLSNRDFNSFLKDKYGSIANAKTTVHHYNKIIERTDSKTGIVTIDKYQIDKSDPRVATESVVPYDNYDDMAETYYPNIDGNFKDGSAVTIVYKKEIVYCYEYEYNLNEEKREINLIDKKFLPEIIRQFNDVTNYNLEFLRDIRNY